MNDENKDPKLVKKAISIGENLFDEQASKGFGAAELQERLFAESRNGLKEYRKQIWEGYTKRSLQAD